MADHGPLDMINSREQGDIAVEERPQSCREQRSPSPRLDQQRNQTPKDDQAAPPDGGYGWVCVACVFWINAHTWGINSVGVAFLDMVK